MLKVLLEIISISCFAFLIAQATGFIQGIKAELNIDRLKPFDCTLCLSFWTALIYSVVINNGENIFIYISICPILGYYLENKL
jgi:hypothetical protein